MSRKKSDENVDIEVSSVDTDLLVEILERLRLLDSTTSRMQEDLSENTKIVEKIYLEVTELKQDIFG